MKTTPALATRMRNAVPAMRRMAPWSPLASQRAQPAPDRREMRRGEIEGAESGPCDEVHGLAVGSG